MSSENGPFRVIAGDGIAVEESPGAFRVSLMDGGVASSEYNGMFKVVDNGDETLSIVDGSNPGNYLCGFCDVHFDGSVGGENSISRVDDLPKRDGNLFLWCVWRDARYMRFFSFETPGDSKKYGWTIATVRSGVVHQAFFGYCIYFSSVVLL